MADLEKEKLSEEDMNKMESSNSVEKLITPEEEYERHLNEEKIIIMGTCPFDRSRDNRCGRSWTKNTS